MTPGLSYPSEFYARAPLEGRVFISSEMGHRNVLYKERQEAAAAIESVGLFRPWLWERDAHAGPYSSEDICLGNAAHSDALILIIGRRLTPMTRKEYETALAAGATCLVLLKEGVPRDKAASRFVQRVQRRATTKKFSNLGELRSAVVYGLRAAALRAMRRNTQAVRVHGASPSPQALGAELDTSPLAEDKQVVINKSVRVRIARARRTAADGKPHDAFTLMSELVLAARSKGQIAVASELLDELRRLLPSSALADRDRAWLLNLEGLLQSSRGHHQRATHTFARMLAAGRRLRDTEVAAVALQHLGVQSAAQGHPLKALKLYKRGLALKLASKDYHGAVQILLNAAAAADDAGRRELSQGLLTEAGRILRQMSDPALAGSLHAQLGRIAAARSEFPTALLHFRKALSLGRASRKRDRRLEIVALQNLGSLEIDRGRLSHGLRWYAKALRLARKRELPTELELLHRSRGTVLHQLGRYGEAKEEFESAAKYAADIEIRHIHAMDIANLGASRISCKDPVAARVDLTLALDAFVILGDKEWQARVLGNLAHAALATGDDQAALQWISKAIRLLPPAHDERVRLMRLAAERAIETRDEVRAQGWYLRVLDEVDESKPATIANEAAMMAGSLATAGWPEAAIELLDRGLRVAVRRRDEEARYRVLNDRGVIFVELERYGAARRDLEVCLRIARQRQNRGMEQQALQNLGELARRVGHFGKAVSLLRKSLRLARGLGIRDEQGSVLGNLGLALSNGGHHAKARDAFRVAARIGRETGNPEVAAAGVSGLGNLAFMHKRYKRAAALYARAALMLRKEATIHRVEAHAARLLALASAGSDDIERRAQRLVNLAQRLRFDLVASEAFARLGTILARSGKREKAAEAFATAIALALTGSSHSLSVNPVQWGEAAGRAMGLPLGCMVAAEPAQGGISELVYQKLRAKIPGTEKRLEPMLRDAANRLAGRRSTGRPRRASADGPLGQRCR